MPWHLSEDLAHFKAVTLGCPVIMGRKTWESLPARARPLPFRRNIILTRQPKWGQDYANDQVVKANTIEAAISPQIVGANVDQVWVIGGGQIYSAYLPLASRLEVTEINAEFEGDTRAPTVNDDWEEVNRIHNMSKEGLGFDFVTYRRKASVASIQSILLF